MPHPDGVQRIHNASGKLKAARDEMMRAHRRLNAFIERGTSHNVEKTRKCSDNIFKSTALLHQTEVYRMNKSFPKLKAEADRSLIDFLKLDLKLGLTFVDLAEQHHTEEDRAKSLANARRAVDTVRHFQGRIRDHAEWTEIHAEANRLDKLLKKKLLNL